MLSRLRTALGAELISASVSGYRLNITADDVDALRFEALRERAAHAPDAAAAGLLEAALALWRGPAYAEFADRDFASAEASRLNELHAATVRTTPTSRYARGVRRTPRSPTSKRCGRASRGATVASAC